MLKKKKMMGILSTALLCIIIAIGIISDNYSYSDDVIGTFCSGQGISLDDQYIALFSDGTFSIYQQFGILFSGVYSKNNYEGQQCLQLDLGNGQIMLGDYDSQNSCIIFRNASEMNLLYYQNYYKITDKPVLINVDTLVGLSNVGYTFSL